MLTVDCEAAGWGSRERLCLLMVECGLGSGSRGVWRNREGLEVRRGVWRSREGLEVRRGCGGVGRDLKCGGVVEEPSGDRSLPTAAPACVTSPRPSTSPRNPPSHQLPPASHQVNEARAWS
eukprot:146070-Chlamydomonas_euryale.AAC.2